MCRSARNRSETRTILLQTGKGCVPDPDAGKRLALQCLSVPPYPFRPVI